jgi:putative methyltransferase (TIGR04325 family)
VSFTLPFSAFRRVRRTLVESPGIRALRLKLYEQRLAAAAAPGSCFGVYGSFEEAKRAIPKNRLVGYDQPEMAAMYRERTLRVYPADYPVLYWLSKFMPGTRRLLDFGGHVGLQYYSYQRYLQYPEGLKWTICDVPEVIKAGRELAAERGATGLTFTQSFDEAEGADVLLTSGSLQFLEGDFLPNALAKIKRRPPHFLVNRTPVHPSKQYVTLHDNGPACHAYTVFDRGRFLSTARSLGYELVDEWEVAELHFSIPCYPDYDVPAYSGFYFRATA